MTATPSDFWNSFACHPFLGVLTDLDGTLLPFAGTPEEARPAPALLALLEELAALIGVRLAVVSGRPKEDMERFFGAYPAMMLVAEHGAWRRQEGTWQALLSLDPRPLDPLYADLLRLAERYPGALVERKTWSVALHFRRVPVLDKSIFLVQAAALLASFLERHPDFERLDGSEVLEVRPVQARKSRAVAWMRESGVEQDLRLVALGDDVTDEDLFAALGPEDPSILVGEDQGRATLASWRLPGPHKAQEFLRWLVQVRKGEPAPVTALPEGMRSPTKIDGGYRLLVISNRLPELRSASAVLDERTRNVGGLVSALQPVLAERHGVWLGWSGRTLPDADGSRFGLDETSQPALAWLDFPEAWHRHYYNGLCNSALWPLFHSFPGRVRFSTADWLSYVQVNEVFAGAAARLVGPDQAVWAHDYHLLLIGQQLRRRGHTGPIGLFLHIPFPGADIFSLFPWAEELMGAMLDFTLIGFHTPGYAENFRQCAVTLLGDKVRIDGEFIEYRGRRTRAAAYPIGIIPEAFQEPPGPAVAEEVAELRRSIAPSRLVLGVDRLDYTKGIRERLVAFGCLLELFPEWRRQVSLVQISVPSRADIPEYAEQRAQVENTVGRINGEFGEAHWVPIRYLYRSYSTNQLSELYRAAAVGYVTPLRDGMNLVAKEYVAAQEPGDPGVLLLSRFAGAAVELRDAVLTNPWHSEGMARDLDRALRMPLAERQMRHGKLVAAVSGTTALTWAEDFLRSLTAGPEGPLERSLAAPAQNYALID